ncbi:AEC family transporter [Thermus filiformis]|uniref:Transporter n=1 Tax=Thermus filiformis TaxID=276 RepID=A0A0A2WRD0_THEFI|nr:AEC family transporter [Thermus filiformis]KGQ20870.1 transporter [Thermus filiformis]
MEALLNTVAPVGLIVALGFLLGRRQALDLTPLSRLTLYLLVPALIFDSMRRSTLSAEAALGLVLGFALTYALLFLAALLLARALGLEPPLWKTLLAGALFPNSGNMGLSLTFFALGAEGLERAVVYFIASSVLMFGLGPAFLRGGGVGESLLFTLRLPLFWALAGGLLLRGVPFPFRLDEGVHLLGQAAIPVLLTTLGLQLAQTRVVVGGFEVLSSLLRLVLAPLLAHGVGLLLGLGSLEHKVLVLQSAMPTAVNAFLMSREFGGDPARAARSVVASTLLAFLTLPLVLLALGVR